MQNPFRNLDEIQRDLGAIAVQLTQVQFVSFGLPRGWQPAINVFRCGGQFVVCAELAGIERDSIQVQAEARRLVIRGQRDVPEPAGGESPAVHILALEIDHGPFERTIEFPVEIEPHAVIAEHRNGLLWIKLPLRPHG